MLRFSHNRLLPLVIALSSVAACDGSPHSSRDSAHGAGADTTRTAPAAADTTILPDSIRRPVAPLVARPTHVRGLYVNRWVSLGQKMWQLIDVARTTEVNALVLDVKDDRGFVLYRSRVPLAREIGADTNMPMRAERVRAILDTMRVHGIYPIARIVVAKDPLLAQHRLDWAIKRKAAPDEPWLDKNHKPWLDPHQAGVWTYAADLAEEAVALGFSEIQFDYVRFPDDQRLVSEAVFPLSQGRLRAQVIREQLTAVRRRLKPLGVPMTIDVFGLTTSDTTDMGIGQRWEAFVDAADVVLPMTYPSHYAPGSYGFKAPNARPYEVLAHALDDAKRRSSGIAGAARIVPWYQDFTLGPPHYGATQVRAQMKAGYDNGFHEWMLWNPGSRYTLEALRPEGSDPAPAAPASR